MKRRNSRAQTLLEYVVLFGVVVGSLIAMGVFFTRAFQARFRQSADVFGEGEQYEKPELCDNCVYASLDVAGEDIDEGMGAPRDPCEIMGPLIDRLEREIANLRTRADGFDQRAADIEEQAEILRGQGSAQQADELLRNAQELRRRAQEARDEADSKEEELNGYIRDFPACV